jgi:hypothetical protein
MTGLSKGDEVAWDWGKGTARGKVAQVFYERVERSIKGHKIVRNANRDEPAYLIRQDDGDEVLKSASEVRRA